MEPIVTENRAALIELCEQFGIERLEVFGSASGNTDHRFDPARSDIDLLIVRESPKPGQTFVRLLLALEDLFQRRVDVQYDRAIRNPFFRRVVDDEREVIYDAATETTTQNLQAVE